MAWKDTVTAVSGNIFPNLVNVELSGDFGTYEASPNMPLQMFLFFNVFLFPFWFIITLVCMYIKLDCLGNLTKFLSLTVLTMATVIECMRLYLGYLGNLSERIPELAGFWMLSVLLQLPLQTFLLANPYLQPRPLEVTLQSIMWLLLIAELLTGFVALRIASSRAKLYYSFKSLAKRENIKRDKRMSNNEKIKEE